MKLGLEVLFNKPYTIHENGFLQIHLSDDTRMHIWHPYLAASCQQVSTQIHNHRFGFFSIVMCGCLIDQKYDCSPVNYCSSFNFEYWVANRTKIGPPLIRSGEVTVPVLKSIKIIEAGSSYSYEPGEWHCTSGAEGMITATVFQKTSVDKRIKTAVICPSNLVPDNSFRRDQIDPDLVKTVIGHTAAMIKVTKKG